MSSYGLRTAFAFPLPHHHHPERLPSAPPGTRPTWRPMSSAMSVCTLPPRLRCWQWSRYDVMIESCTAGVRAKADSGLWRTTMRSQAYGARAIRRARHLRQRPTQASHSPQAATRGSPPGHTHTPRTSTHATVPRFPRQHTPMFPFVPLPLCGYPSDALRPNAPAPRAACSAIRPTTFPRLLAALQALLPCTLAPPPCP